MENRRRKSSSGDKFSFPTSVLIKDQDSDFEFGGVTPESPKSPADHLFVNGRLLPHVFLAQPAAAVSNYSRSTSSSKDSSLMSSRSNSTTSSRSSSCSSGRTSTSEASNSSSDQRKLRLLLSQSKITTSKSVNRSNRSVLNPQYGSSQRLQFITQTPVVLNQQVSRLKKAETAVEEEMRGKVRSVEDKSSARTAWFGRRLFRSFVSACKECHAMEPSTRNSTTAVQLQ